MTSNDTLSWFYSFVVVIKKSTREDQESGFFLELEIVVFNKDIFTLGYHTWEYQIKRVIQNS